MFEKLLPPLLARGLTGVALLTLTLYASASVWFLAMGSFDISPFGLRIYMGDLVKPLQFMGAAFLLLMAVSKRGVMAVQQNMRQAPKIPARLCYAIRSLPQTLRDEPPPFAYDKRLDFGLVPFLYGCLALYVTWPLATGLATLFENLGDPVLNSWILWRMNENLLTRPFDIMAGNIFYPYNHVMANSEHLFGGVLLTLPLHIFGVAPTVQYNLLFLATFPLNGVATYHLSLKLTGRRGAAFLAGAIFAFALPRYAMTSHLQLLLSYGIPLSFLFWVRYLEKPNQRDGWLFALFVTLTMLSNLHFAVYIVYALFFWALCELILGGDFFARTKYLLAPMAASITLQLPFILPYLGGGGWKGEDISRYANIPDSFLAPYEGSLWYPAAAHTGQGDPWFVGYGALTLAAVGLVALTRGGMVSRRSLSVLTLIGVLAAWASCGPDYGLYQLLYDHVPGFDGIRAVNRVAILWLLALALVAAEGLRFITDKRKGAPFMVCVILLLFLGESAIAPRPYQFFHPLNYERFAWMAERDEIKNILLLPIEYEESQLTLASAYHRKRMINGYSGHFPPLYNWFKKTQGAFPTTEQISVLQALKVDHLVVTRAGMERYQLWPKLAKRTDLTFVEQRGDLFLYHIAPKEIRFDLPRLLAGDLSQFVDKGKQHYRLQWNGERRRDGVLITLPIVMANDGDISIPTDEITIRVEARRGEKKRIYETSAPLVAAGDERRLNLATLIPPGEGEVSITLLLMEKAQAIASLSARLMAAPPRDIPIEAALPTVNLPWANGMLDRKLQTNWVSKKFFTPGMEITLRLTREERVRQVQLLNTLPTLGDHPLDLILSGSSDGKKWRELGRYENLAPERVGNVDRLRLTFAPVTLKYLKLAPTRHQGNHWWSVHELFLY